MDTEQAFHRKMAADRFNAVWNYLEKAERTLDEDDAIIHMAHASRHHWAQAGTAVNLARGEWHISRVYSTLRRAEPALYHAARCLDSCVQNRIGDFDLAFAYEALARASAVAGKSSGCAEFLRKAREAAGDITETDDHELLLRDLETVPKADTAAEGFG
jgi:hypothetical protein